MKIFLLTVLAACCFMPQIQAQEWTGLNKIAEQQENLRKWDIVNLLDSVSVKVSENGSGTFSIRRIIKIQTPQGALKNRIIKYDYDPLTAFAEFSKIRIYKANGSFRDILPTSAQDYPAPARAIYWGARQVMAELGRLDEGDIIDYEIHKKGFTYALLNLQEDEDRFIPPMAGQFYDIIPFWVSEPTIRKVYRVAIPQEKDLQFEFYQGMCQSSLRFEEGYKVFSFKADNITPISKESNMVDPFDAAPKLMMSTTADWKAKSLWFHKVNEDYGSFSPTPEAQKKVDELLRGIKDEMEKIAVLTHWVADNMRYSGISMGKGEGFTLHNTQMNFTDRCGVCKDKAALLISMLRMAGFEAYPAMTMAGSRVESIPADHFNHSVAVVKLSDGKYIPLDPTWVPFVRELWSSAEQQQNYLPGLPEGSDLLKTPLSNPENHYFKLRISSVIDERGTLSGEFTVTAEGQSDASVRRVFTSGLTRSWKNSLEKELFKISPKAELVRIDYGKKPENYLQGPIKISMKFIIPEYALFAKDVLIYKPVIFTDLYNQVRSYLRINTSLETREYGFKDACSRYVELEEKLEIPKGYRMRNQNRETSIDNSPASFYGSMKEENRQVQIIQKLTLRKRVYDANDWPAFKEALNAHKSFAAEQLIFEKN